MSACSGGPAIAQDLPFQLELPGGSGPYPTAWLWQLRGGGVAFVFAGYRPARTAADPGAQSERASSRCEPPDSPRYRPTVRSCLRWGGQPNRRE
jgi:hypothetical protein